MNKLCHRMIYFVLCLTSLLSGFAFAQGARFDCAQAGTHIEKMSAECLSGQYITRLAEINKEILLFQYADQSINLISIKQENWEGTASLVVRFTVPVDDKLDWRQFLQVSRNDQLEPAANWQLGEDPTQLIYPFLEPGSEYEVSMRPGIRAINGSRAAKALTETVTTPNVEPVAGFNSRGHVLSNAVRKGLPVTTMNIDEVEVDFFQIKPEAIASLSKLIDARRRRDFEINEIIKDNPLVYSARFAINHHRNQRTTTNLDLAGIGELDQSGVYFAVLRIPGQYKRSYDTTFFSVSDIGIQARAGEKNMRVYAHSLKTGEPRDDIEVELYNREGLVAGQITNKNGEVFFDEFYREGNTLIARHGDEVTLLQYGVNPLDFSAYPNALTRHSEFQVFAWGPRDLYRPGETVHINALLKNYDGQAVDSVPVEVRLFDATGTRIKTRVLNVSGSGHYAFTHDLEASASTGDWRLGYYLPGEDRPLTEYQFKVEDFLPERIDLKLFDGDPTKRRLVNEAKQVNIPVNASYLYGAPAAGNKVDGFVLAEIDRHPFEEWTSYYFGHSGERVPGARYTLMEQELDQQGSADLPVDISRWSQVNSPLAMTASVSVHETGGRPVTRRATLTNILADELVGVEPQFDGRPDSNSRVSFKVILTDAEGTLKNGKGYRVSLVHENRNYYWTYSDSTGWRWAYDSTEYEAFSQSLEFDGRLAPEFSFPVKWGDYRLEIFDSEGKRLNRHHFSTRWSGWNQEGDALKPDQVLMTLRDSRHTPGETAFVTMTPPVDGLAMVTVESNEGVLWRAETEVSAKGTELEIPVGSDWDRHDLYITALVLTPGDMKHSVAPKRSFGLIHLPLRRTDASLTLEIDIPEKIEPSTTVDARLKLISDTPPKGQAWVTLAAVDVGVLNITRFNTPDPLGYLFGARRYDYRYYDVYGRIIENAGFDYSSQKFGGGFQQTEADLVRGGDKPDNEVRIVSIQTQPVKFNADGEVVVPVDVPEFNGRLRWMAVAWSDNQFGSADQETVVADKVVTQLSRPRFLALNDESRVTLDLSNQSDDVQVLDVSFKVSGVAKAHADSQELTLQPGERQTLSYPVKAKELGTIKLEAQVNNQDDDAPVSISRVWNLSVRSAYPAVTRQEQMAIQPGQSWAPGLDTSDLLQESVSAQLILSSTPPIDFKGQFDNLLRYPYGCTEQTISTGFPWVLTTTELADNLGLQEGIKARFDRPFSDQLRKDQLETAVNNILTQQKSSGGFSLWNNAGSEDPWLTVYASDFLVMAREMGAVVPNEALNKALDRTEQYLTGQASIQHRWSDRNEYYSFATRAYAGYVLAIADRDNLSHLRRLMAEVPEMDDHRQSVLSWAYLGYSLQKAGDSLQANLAFSRAQTAEYVPGYYGEYGSELRDLALAYVVMNKAGQPASDMLMSLFDALYDKNWLSTQERFALLRAASVSMGSHSEKLEALIQTKNHRQQVDQSGSFRTILSGVDLNQIEAIGSSGQTVYATLNLTGEQKVAPEKTSNQVAIQREFFTLEGKPLDLTAVKSGDLVIARIEVKAEKRMPDALVVDLLPAGLELENQNLSFSSVDLSQLSIDGDDVLGWQDQVDLAHMEYRDDRFVVALALPGEGTQTLYYLARAVTPGQYTVPPSYVEDMYRPYYFGTGVSGGVLTIAP